MKRTFAALITLIALGGLGLSGVRGQWGTRRSLPSK